MLSHLRSLLPFPTQGTRVLGIDLGTTQCAVAALAWDGASPLAPGSCASLGLQQPTREGGVTSTLIPSVVALLPEGAMWVGEGARRLRGRPSEAHLVAERNVFFDTKNEMGLRRRFVQAPPTHDMPWKVASHILRFLVDEGSSAAGWDPERVVVTVPASFQLAQRRDTLEAARAAGLVLEEHDLLDEPTAALVAYLMEHPEEELLKAGQKLRALVFDFGGGTCDVSIAELSLPAADGPVKTALLATSRYHRLGGGDLDAAIVFEHLIPMLLSQNGLSRLDLTWTEKKKLLAPQLLGTAEALKVALCREVERLEAFGRLDDSARTSLTASQPDLTCLVNGRELSLRGPSLSLQRFEQLLAPFLDRDHLYLRETEYRLSQSIFAPLEDALERARTGREELDLVLLVGGSSLIPQVRAATTGYFSQAKVLAFSTPAEVKTCVSRGAAWHAFALEMTGKPLIQPVVPDSLTLLTGPEDEVEPLSLVPAGMALPFPPDGGFMKLDLLAVPSDDMDAMKLEVVAQGTGQAVLLESWRMDEAVAKGEPVTLEYRLSASQELDCHAYLTRRPHLAFQRSLQNPLTHIVNPHAARARIEETEDALRQKPRLGPADARSFELLARDHAQIAQHEKAIDCLRTAQRLEGRASSYSLNLMGIYCGALGDTERELGCYRESAAADPSNGIPLFNAALALRKLGRLEEALTTIDKAIVLERSGPGLALRGQILEALGRVPEAQNTWQDAYRTFDRPKGLDGWELHWFIRTARSLGKDEEVQVAESLQAQRETPSTPMVSGERPALRTPAGSSR